MSPSGASINAASNSNNRENSSNTAVQKVPHGGPSLMGAAHGNLGGPVQSPTTDAKMNAVAAGGGFPSAEEKGFSGNPGGAGLGRLGLDSNSNAMTVHKRLPKEETV